MNGISLMKIFQRAVGWCKTVYLVKCLTREQTTLSGYVIFRKTMQGKACKQKQGKPADGFRNGDSRNSISIRVVPRKLMPSSLSLRRRLFFSYHVKPPQMAWLEALIFLSVWSK